MLNSAFEMPTDHTHEWSRLIDSFDGFVYVVPEYNHSFPGVATVRAQPAVNTHIGFEADGFMPSADKLASRR